MAHGFFYFHSLVCVAYLAYVVHASLGEGLAHVVPSPRLRVVGSRELDWPDIDRRTLLLGHAILFAYLVFVEIYLYRLHLLAAFLGD